MAHRRDRSPRGHRKGTTFLAGLTERGLAAPYVTDGAMSGRLFRAWAEQALAPTLAAGDVVVMDDLPAHKVGGVREAIEAWDAALLLLTCHPTPRT